MSEAVFGAVFFIALIVLGLGWVGIRFFSLPIRCESEDIQEKLLLDSAAKNLQFGWLRVWLHLLSGQMGTLRRNWRVWMAPLLMLIVLSAGIYFAKIFAVYHDAAKLDLYELSGQKHIRQTLVQEKLALPAALPPTLFISSEHTDLASANRDWNRLDPLFTQQVLHLFSRMAEQGYPMALLEGYRSAERQDMLAAKGSNVTQVSGLQSKHQYGMAVDVAPLKNGMLMISEKDPWCADAYALLGKEAVRMGLTWGGDWSFQDLGHIELKGNLASLLKIQVARNNADR